MPANDVLESISELGGRPVTHPEIPELLDDLPDDAEAGSLDPIRLEALRMRGIDPSLLDEPIVDDFDTHEAVIDGADAVLDDDVEEIEDLEDHEEVLEDDFEDVSGEMLVDPSLVSFEDDVDDEEPVRSVRPLPTPPPPPPRKR